MPIKKANKEQKIPLNNLKLLKIAYEASGINSVIEIAIIIVKEKLKENVINLLIFSLCHLKKIGITPNIVDIPAKNDIKKGIKKAI